MLEIPVECPADLNTRFELLRPKISQTETEDSWEVISKNLKAFSNLCQNGGACEFPTELITIIRSISRPITNSLTTERTRLSSVAIDLISVLATGLGKSFKPLLQIFLPTLLSLCGRTNKVIVTRAKACIMIIIETTQLSAILSYFVQSIDDKSTSIRLAAAEGTLTCLNCFNPPDLEKDARVGEVETIIRASAKDAQADIRVVGRRLFEAYKVLLPKRVESFTGPLSPTTKKYLDIKSKSNAQSETSHAAAPHTKNQLSSSTSAISKRGRTEAAHSIHARSASSSNLPFDGRVKTTDLSTKATATTSLRQKTEMLPPAFIPVRPSTKTVSVTRSTSAAETRPRVVSTTPPLRAGAATTESHQPHRLPVRPNSATSYHEVPQRIQSQTSAPIMSGPSGPRRVPISGPGLKVEETGARPQAPVPRSRAASNPNAASQPDNKVTIPRVPQGHVREKPRPIVKTLEARPLASSRAPTAADTSKPSKTTGVTQPTLSQISRAKATAERKQANNNAPKSRGGRMIAASSRVASQRNADKSGSKPTGTEVKRSVQPAAIPLPSSPTHSSQRNTEKGGSKSTGTGVKKPAQPATIPLPPSPTHSGQHDTEKGGSKSTETGVKKPAQPATIPLPPSPTQSSQRKVEEGTEVKTPVQPTLIPLPPSPIQSDPSDNSEESPSLTPVTMLQMPVPSQLTQSEDVTPPVGIQSPHDVDDKTDTRERAAEHDKGNEPDHPAIERRGEDHIGQLEGPTTPTLPSADNIFDTNAKTPISSLLASIERGFMFTPSSPLSPPQSYANRGMDMAIPFPLSMDGFKAEDNVKEGMKQFMFGIGEEYGRSTLSNVENLDRHK